MDDIVRIGSGVPWEAAFGYSRAVKAGDWVAVSSTAATDENGRVVGHGQIYVQARQAILNIASALQHMGLGLEHVVRTRLYVSDLTNFSDIARAHREMFGAAPPASTLVQVARFIHPDILIEIEADAYAGRTTRDALGDANARSVRKPRAAATRPARGSARRR